MSKDESPDVEIFRSHKLTIFGDSHVNRMMLPNEVTKISNAGEKLINWPQYENDLRGHEVLLILLVGNICPKQPGMPAESTITEAIND